MVLSVLGLVILGVSIVRSTMAMSQDLVLVGSTSQNSRPVKVVATVAQIPTPSPIPAVEYKLVYPGILPDHFLYPLKMVRDKVRLLFTRGVQKKTELLIFYADKRLGAAKALIEGGKETLGVATAGKAEKYLERSFREIEKGSRGGEEIKGLWKRLNLVARKHVEIMEEVSSTISPGEKRAWNKAMDITKIVRDTSAQKILEIKEN